MIVIEKIHTFVSYTKLYLPKNKFKIYVKLNSGIYMDYKSMYKVFAVLSFLITLVVYTMTVQPSVPFWDCGEFTAASLWQQVPHPPGTPLFLMIGRIFTLILPFGDIGWRVNMVSVVANAFSILFLYLIIVKVIENFKGKQRENLSDALAVYGAAFVGAIAYCFSDTFWFNGVESEVYATSSLFTSIAIYLMMLWNEKSETPGNERYILLTAYIMGLSTGVHLLALLVLFGFVYVIYFRKYKFSIPSFIITSIIAAVAFLIILPGIVNWMPTMLSGNLPFRNKCHEPLIENNPIMTVMMIGIIALVGVGLWYGYKRKNSLLNLICASFLLVVLGNTTFIHTIVRSNAHPPINENEPKDFASLTSYLGREQYGEAPNYPRRYHGDDEYYIKYYEGKDDKGEYIYGEWIPPERVDVECKDNRMRSIPEFKNTNFAGEMSYMVKYQINRMFLRYFFWNFVGRKSDVQDAEECWFDKKDVDKLNWDSGYKSRFPVRFYAIPLFLGLFGLFLHFYKDQKMAFAYLVLFLLMGVLTALYQNQQEPQPRERDYFYAGCFYIFAVWIGLGAYGLIKGLKDRSVTLPVTAVTLIISFLIVPVNMAVGGWGIHSRAGDWIPFDYPYNILQSCEKDAILFTNGDNDTFPLWFLQDVEGIRRDIRVVNLSLGNTLWYLDQLKNREPWGAKKVPLSFSDDSIQVPESDPKHLDMDYGEALNVTIPVKKEILAKYTNDTSIINKGVTQFQFVGKAYGERQGKQKYLFRIQDKLILDILRQTKWERPVYYSVTVGPDAFCGLESFFRNEGMAMRICPVSQKSSPGESIDPEIMEKCLLTNVDNTNNFHTEPHYGFKFRNLNNSNVYYDEVHRRLLTTYRSLYLSYANYELQNRKNPAKCIALLDSMNNFISPKQFPLSFEIEFQLAKLYKDAGAKDKADIFSRSGIKTCMFMIDNPDIRPELLMYEAMGRYFGPYQRAAYLYDYLGEYASAKAILERFNGECQRILQTYQGNPGFRQYAQQIQMTLINVQMSINEYNLSDIEAKSGIKAALDTARYIKSQYEKSQAPEARQLSMMIQKKIQDLEIKAGIRVENIDTLGKPNQ